MEVSNISQTIADILKCFYCDNYLTCAPVYLRHEDGEAICEQCKSPEVPATRNKHYEAAAKYLMFPCKYENFGCVYKISFSEEKPDIHEESCRFKPRMCPIIQSGQCEWIGTWKGLLEHCSNAHPNHILTHPCTLIHDISISKDNIFLLNAFDSLFLLYTKVCTTSGKIYHSVRYLGDSENADNYKYNLDIKRNDMNFTKPGQVAPEGCLALQEKTALTTGINSLLDFFGDYEGTTFTITIQSTQTKEEASTSIGEATSCNVGTFFSLRQGLKYTMNDIEQSRFKETLNFSNYNASTSTYKNKNSECKICGNYSNPLINMNCLNCNKKMRHCKNKFLGCNYMDIHNKCQKHELYFCKFNMECDHDDCNIPIIQGKLFKHYSVIHDVKTYSMGTTVLLNNTNDTYIDVLLSSRHGTFECQYYLSNRRFQFEIFSPISTGKLRSCSCSITVINPKTGDTKHFNPRCNMSGKEDWNICLDKRAMGSWSNQLYVVINVQLN